MSVPEMKSETHIIVGDGRRREFRVPLRSATVQRADIAEATGSEWMPDDQVTIDHEGDALVVRFLDTPPAGKAYRVIVQG